MSSFDHLGLHANILDAITEAGYTQPTPIQREAIPIVIKGGDVRASAQTGTGKTAAFILPALHRLASSPPAKGPGPRILILVPTRELATQVASQAKIYGKHLSHLKVLCMIGGVPYHAQKRMMQKPYDILIATPGRLIDYLERGCLKLSRVEMLILDEADRMLDMGFIGAVEHISEQLPEERQTLLFSATLSPHIMKLSNTLMRGEPHEIFVEPVHEQKGNITQILHYTDDLSHKQRLLDHILSDASIDRAIIFTSTKQHADELTDQLFESGHSAAALHGDMHQRQRTRTLAQLRQGTVRILVATDVAARGIDIPTITHVINFDLPRNIEDYVHRIGRTGRAGAKGTAISFAGYREKILVHRIEKFTGQPLDSVEIPGLEPQMKPKKAPADRHQVRKHRASPSSDRAYGKPGRSSSKPFYKDKKNSAFSSQSPQKAPYGKKMHGKRPDKTFKVLAPFKKKESAEHLAV